MHNVFSMYFLDRLKFSACLSLESGERNSIRIAEVSYEADASTIRKLVNFYVSNGAKVLVGIQDQ